MVLRKSHLLISILMPISIICSDISITIGTTRIVVSEGDILQQPAQAIVNAANSSLLGGGGIDGVIHKAAGQNLLHECSAIQPDANGDRCPVGKARLTKAYDITNANQHVQWIIHTVGPLGSDKENRQKHLANAYKNSLQIAQDNNITSIAFPAISSGIYDYDVADAAPVALTAIKDFIALHPNTFKEIRIVVRPQDTSNKTKETFFEVYNSHLNKNYTMAELQTIEQTNENHNQSFLQHYYKPIILASLLTVIGGTFALRYIHNRKTEKNQAI